MNIKQIRTFVTVYKERSVTRAAEALGMTQPSVSLSLKDLEAAYQTKLFEREGRGIRPTDAADHFYPDAVRFLSLYEELDAGLLNWNHAGQLRVGASISIGSCILPTLIRTFHEDYPDLKIFVTIDNSDHIQNLVLENKLDFALIEGKIHSPKLVCERFLEDELLPICSRFHPFAGRDDVSVEELKTENFLLREPNSGTRQQAEACFHELGLSVTPLWESTSTAALSNAVAEGLGISILPKRMLKDQLRTHKLVPFVVPGMNLKRNYNIIYHESKYLTDTMKDFFALTKDV